MCAGEGERWGNYLGIPKHLIKIEGETLLERTVRLIKKYSPKTEIIIVAKPDNRYVVAGSKIYNPNLAEQDWRKDTDKFMSSANKWHKKGRTGVFYGDVWFSEEAMKKILGFKGDDWVMFGRDTGSQYTGKSWGELFCLSFMPEHHKKVKDCLKILANFQKKGVLKRTGGWELYRIMINKEIGIQKGEENWQTINDFTDDFDFPNDYDEWIKRYKAKDDKRLSILIATPSIGDVSIQFTHSLVAMILKTKEVYPDCKIAMATVIRKMHHRARTELAETFLRTDCTHILWLDDDNIPKEDHLIRLVEHNLPLVSGLYFRRVEPFEPIIMVKRDGGLGTERKPDLYRNGKKGLMQIHSTGMGFMLVRREVLEKIHEMNMPMFDIRGGVGEDIWFCIQAQGAGYEIWLDTSVEVGHLGERTIVTSKTYDNFYMNKILGTVEKAQKIDGWCDENELHYLAEMASHSNFTIEVGSYKGRSSTALANSRRLICVDHFKGSKEHNINGNELFTEFKKNMEQYPNVQWLKGNSVKIANNFPNNCADIIFIDASHDYKSVKSDIKVYWEKLGVGGRMLLHDYTYPKFGVKKAADEFVKEMGAFVSAKIVSGSLFEIIKL
jgi:hypothetical protein